MSYRLILILQLLFVFQCCVKSQPKVALSIFVKDGGEGTFLYKDGYFGNDSNVISKDRIETKKLSGQVVSMVDSQIVSLLSYKDGQIWGEDLVYYEDYSVKSYVFRVDEERITFCKKYDSLGNTWLIQGTPLVMKYIGGSKDSVELDFLFADRIFSDFNVKYSLDGKLFQQAKLQLSREIEPYLIFSFISDVRSKNAFQIYFEIETKDKYNGEFRIFKDSLILERGK